MPALRIDFLLSKSRPASQSVQIQSETPRVEFELNSKNLGCNATAILENGEFIVQSGSIARGEWVGESYKDSGCAKLYRRLIKQGVLGENKNNHRVFLENYAFNSTSAASDTILGRSSNGPASWKVKGTAKTYRQWENEEMDKSA